MGRLTKDDLLSASDLREEEVELPSIGGTVLVRGLAARYSNEAQTNAVEFVQNGEEVRVRPNSRKLEELQVLHGLVDPKFETVDEVQSFSEQVGPAWHAIVAKIQKLSGIDEEAVKQTETSFPSGGQTETVPEPAVDDVGAGNGRSDLPLRAGA